MLTTILTIFLGIPSWEEFKTKIPGLTENQKASPMYLNKLLEQAKTWVGEVHQNASGDPNTSNKGKSKVPATPTPSVKSEQEAKVTPTHIHSPLLTLYSLI